MMSHRMSRRELVGALAISIFSSGRVSAKNEVSPATEIFTDVTDAAGINWKHFNGESDDRNLIEAKNGGVAFLDFDGDGLLDILLVNGGETPKGRSATPVRNALYRNLGGGRFEEVARKAGLDYIPFYGIGVAVGDYDNDGFPDIFVAGYPGCALFHNNGNATFTDVTERAGLKNDGRWSTGGVWFDYDRDGLLDLLVCHYGHMSFVEGPRCEVRGMRGYCDPSAYKGDALSLYHNNGDGTFTDVSAQSGVAGSPGRGLSSVAVDVDDDGWIDLFVARDQSPNFLFMNQRNGTFKDLALDALVAYDPNGLTKSGMGIDAGDINGDGRPDFVMTAFEGEYASLLINQGSFPFVDSTIASGISSITRPYVGWGASFIDYDNDGVLDLMIVNGHVLNYISMIKPGVSYREPPLLLRNNGKGVFQNVAERAGPVFRKEYSARGLAVGDFNNDGGIDAIFTCLQDRPVLLRNNVGQNNPWVGFQLQGTKSNRDAIGAKLTLTLGERKLVRWITGGGSIFSAHDNRVVFGLGPGPAPKKLKVEIRWPNGVVQLVPDVVPGRYQKIVEAVA
jgi:hypothetical protein